MASVSSTQVEHRAGDGISLPLNFGPVRRASLLYPELIIRRPPPENLVPEQERLFSGEFQKRLPPVYLRRLRNVLVSGDGLILKNFQVRRENLIHQDHRRWFGPKYLLARYRCKKIRLPADQKFLLAFDYWSNSYFHWLCDVLPRIFAARLQDGHFTILLPEKFRDEFIGSSLRAFGVNNVCTIPDDAVVQVPQLVVPDHLSPTGNYNEETIRTVGQVLRESFGAASARPGRDRIYISRAKANRRRIANEVELQNVLAAFGFRTVHFEGLKFAEQVRLAAGAEYVVSAHGAGLTNMLFMPEGSSVLEIRRAGDAANLCYYTLAAALRHKYLYAFAEACGGECLSPSEQDLKIEPDQIRTAVGLMLQRRAA